MKRCFYRITLYFLFSFVCAACRPNESQQTVPPTISKQFWPASKETDRSHFTVTIEPSTSIIERGKHFSLNLNLQSEENSSSAQVSVDADMPTHRHGMNTNPELVPIGDLRYRVEGMLFHMAGEWIITIVITRDTETDQVAFPVFVE